VATKLKNRGKRKSGTTRGSRTTSTTRVVQGAVPQKRKKGGSKPVCLWERRGKGNQRRAFGVYRGGGVKGKLTGGQGWDRGSLLGWSAKGRHKNPNEGNAGAGRFTGRAKPRRGVNRRKDIPPLDNKAEKEKKLIMGGGGREKANVCQNVS